MSKLNGELIKKHIGEMVHEPFAIMKKELQAYFVTPIAYIVMTFFLIITGFFFFKDFFYFNLRRCIM